jgi:hypothetical protein
MAEERSRMRFKRRAFASRRGNASEDVGDGSEVVDHYTI